MALPTISGGGSFTRQNIQQINSNFQALSQPDVWVRPQNGNNNSADGTYAKPYASLAGLARIIAPGMVIGLQGVLQEEYTTPIINDVTIVGMANEPRQATSGGVPNGGGATWLSPSGGTGALLTVSGQSWKLQNVYLNNSSTTNPVIRLLNEGDPPTAADGAGFTLDHCTMTGADNGLLTRGGGYIVINDSTFLLFDDTGDIALGTEAGGAAGGTGSWMRVTNCQFLGNTRHIDGAFNNCEFAFNHFSYINAGVTTTIQIDLDGGSNNSVHNNYFDLPYSSVQSTMFTLGTNDRWYFNQFATAVDTTTYSFGDPTST